MKILVIEDTAKHLEDAKRFFATQPDVEVVYKKTFCELPGHIVADVDSRNKRPPTELFDGVISDIFFPDSDHSQPEPIGVAVMMLCRELNVPCVLCTDGYHHGDRYQWIDRFQQTLGLPQMIDRSPPYDPSGNRDKQHVANEKSWRFAFETLKKLIEKSKAP